MKGDAAGEIDPGDGTWTESLRERYADRIQARLARHIPNLESALRARVALSPADIEAANMNMVDGDMYSGSLALDQNFLWRPFPRQPGHATPVGSTTSARARIRGPVSAPARALSSPSCSGRRWRNARSPVVDSGAA